MSKDIENWEITTERFVVFFDIMGFKDLVARKKHEEIVELLNKLSTTRSTLEGLNNTPIMENKNIGETKSFTFSDSIIFFSRGASKFDCNKIFLDAYTFIRHALKHQIPIKGAISFGTITLDFKTSVFFGQPIIDAFLLHEELNLYSLIADNQFESQVKKINSNIINDFFEFYRVPLKSGKAYHHVLRPLSNYKDETIENLKKLYGNVSGRPRQYIDNTIDFIESCKYLKKKTSTATTTNSAQPLGRQNSDS